MSNMTLRELYDEAGQFAGLDTAGVFTDLAAGKFVGGWDIMAAIEQVRRLHPNLEEQLATFKTHALTFHHFWN